MTLHRSSLALLVAAAAATCVAACSSPAPGTTAAGDGTGAAATPDAGASAPSAAPVLRILPEVAYSGVDGTHTFRAPVGVYGASTASLVSSDPTVATIEAATLSDSVQDDGVYFMVTARKPGTVTLTATSGGATVTSTFTVNAYTTQQYAAGEARYMTSSTSGPACQSCHFEGGGIDHSPSTMASAEDRDVVSVITTGVLVAGNPITNVKHKWAVTDAEAAGLVTYLRALTPRGFDGVK
jgi:hypothetical protein